MDWKIVPPLPIVLYAGGAAMATLGAAPFLLEWYIAVLNNSRNTSSGVTLRGGETIQAMRERAKDRDEHARAQLRRLRPSGGVLIAIGVLLLIIATVEV